MKWRHNTSNNTSSSRAASAANNISTIDLNDANSTTMRLTKTTDPTSITVYQMKKPVTKFTSPVMQAYGNYLDKFNEEQRKYIFNKQLSLAFKQDDFATCRSQ